MTDRKGEGLKPGDELVELDTAMGRSFSSIYDKVLYKSLKEYVPVLQKRFEECEADRAARLEVIERQGREFGATLGKMRAEIEAMKSSASWRMTAPLRWIIGKVASREKS